MSQLTCGMLWHRPLNIAGPFQTSKRTRRCRAGSRAMAAEAPLPRPHLIIDAVGARHQPAPPTPAPCPQSPADTPRSAPVARPARRAPASAPHTPPAAAPSASQGRPLAYSPVRLPTGPRAQLEHGQLHLHRRVAPRLAPVAFTVSALP